jgi:hypothetical protein
MAFKISPTSVAALTLGPAKSMPAFQFIELTPFLIGLSHERFL